MRVLIPLVTLVGLALPGAALAAPAGDAPAAPGSLSAAADEEGEADRKSVV